MYEIGIACSGCEGGPTAMNARSQPPSADADGPDLVQRELPYGLIFERSPSGMLVLDFAGRLAGHNASARALLGEALDRRPLRCCDLLGCRKPGTPLADACITDLA